MAGLSLGLAWADVEGRHTRNVADAVGSPAAYGHQGLVGDRCEQHARRRRPVDVVVDELLEEPERRAPRVAELVDGDVRAGLHEKPRPSRRSAVHDERRPAYTDIVQQ